jgi:MFS family permease
VEGTVPGTAAVEAVERVSPLVDSRRAWVVVGAATLSTFTLFFIVYSFGTSFSAMSEEFGAGKGRTALLFGFVIFFLFVLSLPAGRVADRIGPRPVMAVGATSLGVGLGLTSMIDNLWLGYATYGFGVGIGVACCYVPMTAQVSGWFDRHRATALGVASAGIGLGTLVGPPTTSWLIDAHGWRWTFRLLGVVGAVVLIVAAALAERAPGAATAGTRSLSETFAAPGFRRFYLSGLLMGLSLFVPFVFLVPYAEDQGIANETAATLVSLLGLGSLSGRLVLGVVAGRLGLTRLYRLCYATMGLSFVLWLVAGSRFAVLAAFALVLGMSYGGYVALSPAVCAHLFGLAGLGGVLGALYTSSGIGGLVGPPLAGGLIDATGSYTTAIVVALVLALAAVVALPHLENPGRR